MLMFLAFSPDRGQVSKIAKGALRACFAYKARGFKGDLDEPCATASSDG
jgi:hypothetical protein